MSDYDVCAHQVCDLAQVISKVIAGHEVVSCRVCIPVRIIPYKCIVIAVIEICFRSLIYFPAVCTDHIILDRRHRPTRRRKDLDLRYPHPSVCSLLIEDPHCLYICNASEINRLIRFTCKGSCFHPLIGSVNLVFHICIGEYICRSRYSLYQPERSDCLRLIKRNCKRCICRDLIAVRLLIRSFCKLDFRAVASVKIICFVSAADRDPIICNCSCVSLLLFRLLRRILVDLDLMHIQVCIQLVVCCRCQPDPHCLEVFRQVFRCDIDLQILTLDTGKCIFHTGQFQVFPLFAVRCVLKLGRLKMVLSVSEQEPDICNVDRPVVQNAYIISRMDPYRIAVARHGSVIAVEHIVRASGRAVRPVGDKGLDHCIRIHRCLRIL